MQAVVGYVVWSGLGRGVLDLLKVGAQMSD